MKNVKDEVVDLDYEEQEEMRQRAEENESLMVARRIKQEFCNDSTSSSRDSPPTSNTNQILAESFRVEMERPAPIIFDHFICMRIGLNARNNVQRLMALLTAHDFVDLTVLPSPSMMSAQMPPMMPMGVSHPQAHMMPPCIQEPSTSKSLENMFRGQELETRMKNLKVKKNCVKKQINKHFIRPSPSADCGIIPINLQCRKCDEIIPKGSHGSLALNHVQKNHLKMAAFQCRICKHYRTTQERIQSHVTTVHKAKSTKFDSSLAGPLSAADMRKMEEMISKCFPHIKMELQVTDRLIAKTMEIDISNRSG